MCIIHSVAHQLLLLLLYYWNYSALNIPIINYVKGYTTAVTYYMLREKYTSYNGLIDKIKLYSSPPHFHVCLEYIAVVRVVCQFPPPPPALVATTAEPPAATSGAREHVDLT